MYRTKRLCQRVKRILSQAQEPERASLKGLEVSESGWGEFIEAGGEDRRKEPRRPVSCPGSASPR
jgi:hypothetical protein